MSQQQTGGSMILTEITKLKEAYIPIMKNYIDQKKLFKRNHNILRFNFYLISIFSFRISGFQLNGRFHLKGQLHVN